MTFIASDVAIIYDQEMGSSLPEFDPYDQWLGIPPQERPADHYRLLGIRQFESDPAVIQAATDERMALVRTHQLGPNSDHTQEVLNELAAAKLTLMDATSRTAYEQTLREATPVVQAIAAHAGNARTVSSPLESRPAPIILPDTREMSDDLTSIVVEAADTAAPASKLSEELETPMYLQPGFLILMAAMLVAVGMLAVGLRTIIDRRGAGQTLLTSGTNESKSASAANSDHNGPLPTESDEPPVLTKPEADGSVTLLASTAQLRGELRLEIQDSHNVITGWTSPDSTAAWRFTVLKPGIYKLELVYAIAQDAYDCSFDIEVAGDGRQADTDRATAHHTISRRGGAGVYVEDQNHLLVRRAGENTLVVRTSTPTPQGLMSLRTIRLTPPRNKTR